MFPGARLSSLVQDRPDVRLLGWARFLRDRTAQEGKSLTSPVRQEIGGAAATIGTLELSQSVQYTYGDGSYSFSECRQ